VADGPYKLQIKIGTAEFSAEGPENTVKEAYEQFLKALAGPALDTRSDNRRTPAQNMVNGGPADITVLDQVFAKEGDIVSLRHLPKGATPAADAAILLLYGYKRLSGIADVPVMRLNEGLRKSGLNFERVDRFLAIHQALYRKGGQKSGSRYSLNNQGVQQAEQWLREWN
jgi:hypothetical protein